MYPGKVRKHSRANEHSKPIKEQPHNPMETLIATNQADKHWLKATVPEIIKRPIRAAWRAIVDPIPGGLLWRIICLFRFRRRYRLGYLAAYAEESACGPLQRDEALLIHGLVRVLRPKVIVEFGFFAGHSAYNFIKASSPDAQIYSYDLHPGMKRLGNDMSKRFRNFRFILKDQESFDQDDVGRQKIDLLLVDASHDVDLNIRTFRKIKDFLAEGGLIIIHDTGTWNKEHLRPIHWSRVKESPEGWLNEDEFEHQPGERRFVNFLAENHPEFSQLHLHSLNTVRHGMTILQRSRPLPTGAIEGESELPHS